MAVRCIYLSGSCELGNLLASTFLAVLSLGKLGLSQTVLLWKPSSAKGSK